MGLAKFTHSPSQKAMQEYVEEALQQGYSHLSTSPAASIFFLVTKKDRSLRPCIDYRALNKITVKFHYLLPLIPAALEQLRGATVSTKLDLQSAYNLIQIREGDEWRTAFVTCKLPPSVDFITNLLPSDGFTCILVIVDRFSKACRIIPLKRFPTAMETAALMFNNVFRTFWPPRRHNV